MSIFVRITENPPCPASVGNDRSVPQAGGAHSEHFENDPETDSQ